MLARWIAAWLIILVLAVLNGFLREAALVPLMGKVPGYLASGLLLAAFIVLMAAALARWMGLASARRALGVGALWLVLTLGFEFGFGILQGRSRAEMLAQYAFADGNIWPLVLVVVLFAPCIGWRYNGAS